MDLYHNPAQHPEAEPFLRAIAQAPGDQLPRLVFADWLEEHGYYAASQGQRWAAKYGKHPEPASSGQNGRQAREGGWASAGSPSGATWGDAVKNPHALPSFMFLTDDGTWWKRGGGHPPMLYRDARAKGSTLDNEHDYLQRSHELNWHPETGEPLDPTA